MISTTPEEQKFIKNNKKILSALFSKRIDVLKDEVLACDPEKREVKIEFVNEFKKWLQFVKVFSQDGGGKKEDFV